MKLERLIEWTKAELSLEEALPLGEYKPGNLVLIEDTAIYMDKSKCIRSLNIYNHIYMIGKLTLEKTM